MALHFLVTEGNPRIGAAAIALGVASYWRFCDRRWRSTELSYATAIIIHRTKHSTRPASGPVMREEAQES
jgi:hypothetical protein